MSDHCGTCGMEWTHPNEVWRVSPSLPVTCSCGGHGDPLQWEKLQHKRGKHVYQAFTLAQARAHAGRPQIE